MKPKDPARLAITIISKELWKWTTRFDDAKRIPDAIFDFGPKVVEDAFAETILKAKAFDWMHEMALYLQNCPTGPNEPKWVLFDVDNERVAWGVTPLDAVRNGYLSVCKESL